MSILRQPEMEEGPQSTGRYGWLVWEKEYSENVRGREEPFIKSAYIKARWRVSGEAERCTGMWEGKGVTGCMCWDWPVSIF